MQSRSRTILSWPKIVWRASLHFGRLSLALRGHDPDAGGRAARHAAGARGCRGAWAVIIGPRDQTGYRWDQRTHELKIGLADRLASPGRFGRAGTGQKAVGGSRHTVDLRFCSEPCGTGSPLVDRASRILHSRQRAGHHRTTRGVSQGR